MSLGLFLLTRIQSKSQFFKQNSPAWGRAINKDDMKVNRKNQQSISRNQRCVNAKFISIEGIIFSFHSIFSGEIGDRSIVTI